LVPILNNLNAVIMRPVSKPSSSRKTKIVDGYYIWTVMKIGQYLTTSTK
jgi:hypothetical protein